MENISKDSKIILELNKDEAIDLYTVLCNFIKENDVFTSGFKTSKRILRIIEEQGV